jgi:hypothetical protein
MEKNIDVPLFFTLRQENLFLISLNQTEVRFCFQKIGWVKPARQDGVQAGGGGSVLPGHRTVVAINHP